MLITGNMTRLQMLIFFLALTHSLLATSGGQQDAQKDYYSIGCYKDSSFLRRVPKFIKDFRSQIDWKDMSKTVQQCADELKKPETEAKFNMKFKYFSVQFYGECWAGGESTANTYFLSGTSKNCYEGTGGSNANFVYHFGIEKKLNRLPPIVPIGCFKADADPNPLPVMIDKINEDVNWSQPVSEKISSMIASKCAITAAKLGYKAFGVMNRGECWSGKNAANTYADGGAATDCKYELGSDKSYTAYMFLES